MYVGEKPMSRHSSHTASAANERERYVDECQARSDTQHVGVGANCIECTRCPRIGDYPRCGTGRQPVGFGRCRIAERQYHSASINAGAVHGVDAKWSRRNRSYRIAKVADFGGGCLDREACQLMAQIVGIAVPGNEIVRLAADPLHKVLWVIRMGRHPDGGHIEQMFCILRGVRHAFGQALPWLNDGESRWRGCVSQEMKSNEHARSTTTNDCDVAPHSGLGGSRRPQVQVVALLAYTLGNDTQPNEPTEHDAAQAQCKGRFQKCRASQHCCNDACGRS